MSAPVVVFERRSKQCFCSRHPKIRPNFYRQGRWLIFYVSRLSAKIGPDASTPRAKLQLLGTIRQVTPRRVRERSEKCFKRLLSRLMSETGPRLKKSVRSVLGGRRFLARIVLFSSVFDDFDGKRFLSTGTMVLNDFTKPPRLSTKFKTAAPVDKSWHRSVRKYAFRLSFGSELFVFAVPVQWNGSETVATQAQIRSPQVFKVVYVCYDVISTTVCM